MLVESCSGKPGVYKNIEFLLYVNFRAKNSNLSEKGAVGRGSLVNYSGLIAAIIAKKLATIDPFLMLLYR